MYTRNGKDTEGILLPEERIREKELEINARFPDAYRKFLLETPFKSYQDFDWETPCYGIIFSPRAMAAVEAFHSTFDRFYVPSGTTEETLWAEPEDGQTGFLKIFLFGGESLISMAALNHGSWTMPCVQIGTLNEDLLIILNCETGIIYCTPHDEVWFEFNSREDYDKEMQVTAQDVFFSDFARFLAWCKGDGVYTPKSLEEL